MKKTFTVTLPTLSPQAWAYFVWYLASRISSYFWFAHIVEQGTTAKDALILWMACWIPVAPEALIAFAGAMLILFTCVTGVDNLIAYLSEIIF